MSEVIIAKCYKIKTYREIECLTFGLPYKHNVILNNMVLGPLSRQRFLPFTLRYSTFRCNVSFFRYTIMSEKVSTFVVMLLCIIYALKSSIAFVTGYIITVSRFTQVIYLFKFNQLRSCSQE